MNKNRILDFWFEGYQIPGGKLLPSTSKKWFMQSPELDSQIKSEFEELLTNVYENEATRKNLQGDLQVRNSLIKGNHGVDYTLRPISKKYVPWDG
jgi:uncharacterized protein (DUF924 family)